MKSLRSCNLARSVTEIDFSKLKFHWWYVGPRNVFRPRLPPPGIVFARMAPADVRGATTIPVASRGIKKVRIPPDCSCRVPEELKFGLKIPFGLKSGRAGVAVPMPALSTPVRIVNGCPDWASVHPEISQPPIILPSDLAQPEENHGTSYR